MTPIDRDQLHGEWVHSHEEDQPGQQVYRPAAQPLPPSRGRSGFRLAEGGAAALTGPGPTDQTTAQPGVWSLAADGALTITTPGQEPKRFRVVSAEPDRLILKP